MKNAFNRIVSAIVSLILVFVLSVSAYADVYIGMVATHGDPTLAENSIKAFRSAGDVARYYPNGSYYSINGKECTCHIKNHQPSPSCNCGRYNYYMNGYNNEQGYGTAYQCAAFAKFCFYEYNGGMDVGHHPDNSTYMTLTSSNLYATLSSIGTYSYIRGQTSGRAPHSVFIVGFTSNTVTIWHSNYTGKCKVENATLTYSEFLSRMNYLNWYYTSDGDYYDM